MLSTGRIFDFKPEPIRILLDTNILNKKDAIPFSRAMFVNQNLNIESTINLTEDVPLFSDKYKYPRAYLNSAPLSRKMEFFFNREVFNEIMSKHGKQTGQIIQNESARKQNVLKNKIEKIEKKKQDNEQKTKEMEQKKEEADKQKQDADKQKRFDDSFLKLQQFLKEFGVFPDADQISLLDEIKEKKSKIITITTDIQNIQKNISGLENNKKEEENKPAPYNSVIEKLNKEIDALNKKIEFTKLILTQKKNELYEIYRVFIEKSRLETDKQTNTIQLSESQVNDLKRVTDDFEQQLEEQLIGGYSDVNEDEDAYDDDDDDDDEEQTGGISFNKNNEVAIIRKQNEIVDYNIRTMLTCLFPTKYPAPNAYSSSWETKINHGPLSFSFPNFSTIPIFSQLFSEFSKWSDETYAFKYPQYSYLKIDGKIYTVTDVIWLSDIYNHTQYRQILNLYNELEVWNKLQREGLEEESSNKIQAFINKYFLKEENKDRLNAENDIKSPSSYSDIDIELCIHLLNKKYDETSESKLNTDFISFNKQKDKMLEIFNNNNNKTIDHIKDYILIPKINYLIKNFKNNSQNSEYDFTHYKIFIKPDYDFFEKIKKSNNGYDWSVWQTKNASEWFDEYIKMNPVDNVITRIQNKLSTWHTAIKDFSVLDFFIFRIMYEYLYQEMVVNRGRSRTISSESRSALENLKIIKDALLFIQENTYSILSTTPENIDFSDVFSKLEAIKTQIDIVLKYPTIIKIQKFETDIFDKLKKMTTDAELIKTNQYLISQYFKENGEINFEFLDDPKISTTLKDKYKKYGEFVNLLKKFSKGSKESSNLFLQKTIQEFIDKIGDDFTYMMNPDSLLNKIIVAELDNYLERFHTGVSYSVSQNPAREIMVRIDLIDGEINDSNVGSIKCVYKGEKLADSLDKLLKPSMNTWELPTKRMIFELQTQKTSYATNEKTEIKQEAPVGNKQQEGNKQEAPVGNKQEGILPQGGGQNRKQYKHTRKLKSNFLKYTIKHNKH